MSHEKDVGYDLQTSLIVSDQTGQPIAPVAQRLVSANGSYSTYGEKERHSAVKNHLDEVGDCIEHLEKQGFAKPLVHLIDREADSAFHLRRLDQAQSNWVIRILITTARQ